MKTCLSIAGSDPVGGAGIQADLKTFYAMRVFGMAVPTAITVQNTQGIELVHPLPEDLVAEQLRVLFADVTPDAVKVGMLGAGGVAFQISSMLGKMQRPPLVLDPIIKGWDGTDLLDEEGIQILREKLIPLADVVTPNLHEASVLTGIDVQDTDGMREAAQAIKKMGAKAVLVKGGHLEERATDILLTPEGIHVLDSVKMSGHATHGTGCALSSAIAAGMSRGIGLKEAVHEAKAFVILAIENGFGDIGKGRVLLNHFVNVPSRGHEPA